MVQVSGCLASTLNSEKDRELGQVKDGGTSFVHSSPPPSFILITLSLPDSIMVTCRVVVPLSLWTKPNGVTIQMKPPLQYFCIVPFVFQ